MRVGCALRCRLYGGPRPPCPDQDESCIPDAEFERAVQDTLRKIVAGETRFTVPSVEVLDTARKDFAEGVDRQRTVMHTGPQVNVTYRPKGGKDKMATFKAIDPTSIAAPGAAGGMKYEGLVKDFIESGEAVAQLEPDEGKSVSSLNVSLRSYLANHPTVPAFVFSRATGEKATVAQKDGTTKEVNVEALYIARSDNEATAGWKPKPGRGRPRKDKAAAEASTEAAPTAEATAPAEAPTASAEGADPFEQLETMGAKS